MYNPYSNVQWQYYIISIYLGCKTSLPHQLTVNCCNVFLILIIKVKTIETDCLINSTKKSNSIFKSKEQENYEQKMLAVASYRHRTQVVRTGHSVQKPTA